MKQISDVIVIGSGIIGAAAVFALTRGARQRVILIDKGPLVSGMTRRSAGLVHPFQPHPRLAELALASYAFYNQWAMHLGPSKSGYVETGAVVIADADAPRLAALAQTLAPLTDKVMPIERAGLPARFPGIAHHFQAGLFTPRAGYADAAQTAQGMVKAAQERGMQLLTGTLVKQILTAHGRVTGVATTNGDVEAPLVIVTAGNGSEKLLTPLGVALHLNFKSGAVLFYEQPQTLPQGHPIFLDVNESFFLRPHPYHMSAAGNTATDLQPPNTDSPDEHVLPQNIARVTHFAARCIPGFGNAQPKRAHTILYDTAADGLPALGRVTHLEGLYVAAGFGTSAFSVAPTVGEILAQLVIDGATARDLSSFNPMRPSLRI
ncbi:MAG: FAD-binding oxidoreductase [Chloroflexi bacterium]|nr:FAD-binding oxidoreductase [Chloroflexota bacterium]